jgi:prevent-host-death family protein
VETAPATVNVYAAKTHFSDLLKRAEAGEVIVIARNGVPAAKLVPIDTPAKEPDRVPGRLRGQIWYTEGCFKAITTPEELEEWFGPEFAELAK